MVKGSVEAGDGGSPRERRGDGGDGGQGRRLVQRRQGGQLPQLLQTLGVEPDRSAEPRPAMDDPVPDGVDPARLGDGRAKGSGVEAASFLLHLVLLQEPVPPVEQAQLQAAGARVYDQYAVGFQG